MPRVLLVNSSRYYKRLKTTTDDADHHHHNYHQIASTATTTTTTNNCTKFRCSFTQGTTESPYDSSFHDPSEQDQIGDNSERRTSTFLNFDTLASETLAKFTASGSAPTLSGDDHTRPLSICTDDKTSSSQAPLSPSSSSSSSSSSPSPSPSLPSLKQYSQKYHHHRHNYYHNYQNHHQDYRDWSADAYSERDDKNWAENIGNRIDVAAATANVEDEKGNVDDDRHSNLDDDDDDDDDDKKSVNHRRGGAAADDDDDDDQGILKRSSLLLTPGTSVHSPSEGRTSTDSGNDNNSDGELPLRSAKTSPGHPRVAAGSSFDRELLFNQSMLKNNGFPGLSDDTSRSDVYNAFRQAAGKEDSFYHFWDSRHHVSKYSFLSCLNFPEWFNYYAKAEQCLYSSSPSSKLYRPHWLVRPVQKFPGNQPPMASINNPFEKYPNPFHPPQKTKPLLPLSLLPSLSPSTQQQLSQQHATESHVCPDCGKRYSTSSNLARHRQSHRQQSAAAAFPSSISSLAALGVDQSERISRKCPHCDKSYVSVPAYNMHVRTHNQGCVCPHCGKKFSRPWLLQGHLRTHTGEKPFRCTQCSKTFADKSNLRAHIQTHSTEKPFVCGRCNKAFALKSYLYKHEESSCMRSSKFFVGIM